MSEESTEDRDYEPSVDEVIADELELEIDRSIALGILDEEIDILETVKNSFYYDGLVEILITLKKRIIVAMEEQIKEKYGR